VNQLSIVKIMVILRYHQGFQRVVLICTVCEFFYNSIVISFENFLVLVAVMHFSNSDLAELKSNCGRLFKKIIFWLFEKVIVNVIYSVPNKSLVVFRDTFDLIK